MATLSGTEKRKFERLLGMGSGYVLDFSNRTFSEFVLDSIGRDIYDSRYDGHGGSKANRLRGFWAAEGNYPVGKLLSDLLDYAVEIGAIGTDEGALLADSRRIADRLLNDRPIPEFDALEQISTERDFETLAGAVRRSIEGNHPESGLDRLHTFVTKYIRSLCISHGLTVTRDKPLHSLFGEYVATLRKDGYIEAGMTERILRVNISILDAFNEVRNHQSLAHDNPMLNHDEALLIFNHVTALVRFLRGIETDIEIRKRRATQASELGDIPF